MSLEERYQWLFRKVPALIVSLDEEGYCLDASDAWLKRFGYTRDEIRRRRPQDLGSAESSRRTMEEYLPALRRIGRVEGVPFDLMTKSGERVDCLASAVVERSDEGDYLRTIVVYTELGEQARLERHYRELYRSTPAMLHTVDARGRIIHVSDHWLNKLGYRREEVLGRLITDFWAEDSQAAYGSRLENIVATGELNNEPRRYLTKSGEAIEALVS